MEKRYLKVTEIAHYLNVSKDTIRAWVKFGKIPFSKLGRSIRFDRYEIEKWLKKKQRLSAYQATVNFQ